MKYILTLLIFVSLLSGCITHKSEQTPTVKPYIGTWDITFSGTATGTGFIVVNNGGIFSNNVSIENETYTVSGVVDNNGTIENGKLGNGTFTGNFGGSSGAGSWIVGGNNGTWAGIKR